MSNPVFCENIRKNITNLSSAELAQRVVMIKQTVYLLPVDMFKICWMNGNQHWPWSDAVFCDLGLNYLLSSISGPST